MHSFNDDKAAPSPPYSETAAPFTEQDNRPLPEGWIRQWDPNYQQYFFVDTKANPPHSIWDHPLDDPQYRKAHGLPSDSDSESSSSSSSSDSESEGGDKKKKKKSGKKLKRPQDTPSYAGPSSAPHPASPGAPRGLFGTLTQGLFGPRPSPQVSPGVAGPSFAGPSVPGPSIAPMQAGMMYAPPSYPYNKRDMKSAKRAEKRAYRAEKREEKRAWKAERRAQKHERRMMKAQRKAMRRGYVPGVPQMPGAPPAPQSPPFPGMSREYQPAPGYNMPSEKRAY